jgi:hypothetical protein
MRHVLHPHPDFPCAAVSAIAVDVSRGITGNLLVHYYISGDASLVVPSLLSSATRQRADELWQHTCFEAFVKPAGSEAYWEFNVAPTCDWQVYALSGYRAGRTPVEAIGTPSAEGRYGRESWELRAHWALGGTVPSNVPWRLGLCAVIEDTGGALSYWALQHPPGKPDFHHDSAFALDLAVTL